MLHSGSRNIGKKVADYHNKIAKELNRKMKSDIPPEWDLAYLPIETEEAQNYLREMRYCVGFAYASRKLMMERIQQAFRMWAGENIVFDKMINIAHNYASLEKHFGEEVWIHRKGATLADKETIGIVPGDQGSASYIVKGLGNPESFKSCSHGAGRVMGRREAIRTIDLEKEVEELNKKGILHAIRGRRDLEEAPSAYKDIGKVMENQKDLVKILVQLKPLAVIKG